MWTLGLYQIRAWGLFFLFLPFCCPGELRKLTLLYTGHLLVTFHFVWPLLWVTTQIQSCWAGRTPQSLSTMLAWPQWSFTKHVRHHLPVPWQHWKSPDGKFSFLNVSPMVWKKAAMGSGSQSKGDTLYCKVLSVLVRSTALTPLKTQLLHRFLPTM